MRIWKKYCRAILKKMYIKILSLMIALLFSLEITGCANEGADNMNDYSVVYDESESSTDTSAKTETSTANEKKQETSSDSKLQTVTYTVKGVDFKMILVEAGTFTMGSDNTDTAFNESPAHTVTLTKDYLMGETEVTEALWNAVMGSGGGYVKRGGSNYHSFRSESYLFTTTGRYFCSSTDWTIGLRIALIEE